MAERIAIYGGAGRWGRRIDRGAKRLGHETLVVDPAAETKVDPKQAAGWATVLVLAVFPKVANQLIEELEDEITLEKKMFDICGRKSEIIPQLRRLNERKVSTVSTHPLTNEKQPLRGQKVLIMPVGDESGEATNFVVDFFSAQRMIPVFHELDRHDEDMAPEQGFPHSLQRAIGHAVIQDGLDLDTLWRMAPANAELFWLSGFRGWNQPSKISAQAIDSFLRTSRGIQMLRNVQARIDEMIAIVEKDKNEERSQQELTDLFDKEFPELQRRPISKEMQERTTIILERLANLRLHSISVYSKEDVPGVLHRLSGAFAQFNINLTAVDSHELEEGGMKFMIGEDSTEDEIAQVVTKLEESGFLVLEVKSKNDSSQQTK